MLCHGPDVYVKQEPGPPQSDNDELPEVSEILSAATHRTSTGKAPARSQKSAVPRASGTKSAAPAKGSTKPTSKAKGPPAPTARKCGRSPQPAQAAPKCAGRQPGAMTYTPADYRAMMDLVRQVLPIGPDEWARVRSLYNERALREGRAERQVKPLRSKFELVSFNLSFIELTCTYMIMSITDCPHTQAYWQSRGALVG